MYISSLTVRDVKGISEARLDLAATPEEAPGWYVLAGGNGSGKTTLLRCFVVLGIPFGVPRFIGPSWVSHGKKSGEIDVSYLTESGEKRQAGCILHSDHSGQPLAFEVGGEPDLKNWLHSGYGAFKRLEGGSDHARSVAKDDPLSARVLTLFLEEASLWEVPKWLFRLGVDENKSKLRRGLLNLLNSGLLPDGFGVEGIVDEDLILRTPNASSVTLSTVSDGPRCMLAMILDILRELELIYGELKLVDGRVEHPGVVLIDEPDNHLHLSWQLTLGAWMKEHFPKIQFIVATHSPFLCISADKIWRLEDETGKIAPVALSEEEMRMIRGGSLSAVLESNAFRVFSTVPPELRNRHLEFLELRKFTLQGKKLSPSDKERLAKLEEEFLAPPIPPDPEFDKLFS